MRDKYLRKKELLLHLNQWRNVSIELCKDSTTKPDVALLFRGQIGAIENLVNLINKGAFDKHAQ